jgi:hypothetical protein
MVKHKLTARLSTVIVMQDIAPLPLSLLETKIAIFFISNLLKHLISIQIYPVMVVAIVVLRCIRIGISKLLITSTAKFLLVFQLLTYISKR